MKKVVSIMIPTYNEEENCIPIYQAVRDIVEKELSSYDYEILFIDNQSKDHTRDKIRAICAMDPKVKAVFNAKNFGQFNSPYYGLISTTGDCTISLCADFQDPVEMIPVLVHEWEKGHDIVCAVKTKSKENPLMYFLRTVYYKMIRRMSDVDMIEHFTGFGLYDKKFIEVLRRLHDPTPFIRGIVAELGFSITRVEYTQAKRRAGKTKNNLWTLFDAAMLSVTSFTKVGLRVATILGFCSSLVSFLIALIYLIQKLLHWYDFTAGMAPVLIGIFLLGSIQLFFIGLLGEYISGMNTRIMRRPLVVVEERLNFGDDEETMDEKYAFGKAGDVIDLSSMKRQD